MDSELKKMYDETENPWINCAACRAGHVLGRRRGDMFSQSHVTIYRFGNFVETHFLTEM